MLIGTEELGHMEMVATLFKKLIAGASKEELINCSRHGSPLPKIRGKIKIG